MDKAKKLKEEQEKQEGKRINKHRGGSKARYKRRRNTNSIAEEGKKYREEVKASGNKLVKQTYNSKMAKISRTSVAYALEGQPIKIKMALDLLFDEDPRAYIDAIAKLLNYAVPKLSSSEVKNTSDRKIEIKLEDGATLEDIKRQLEEIENDNAQDIDFEEID